MIVFSNVTNNAIKQFNLLDRHFARLRSARAFHYDRTSTDGSTMSRDKSRS